MKKKKAEYAAKALARAIVALTDLFYQFDTRKRFMNALTSVLIRERDKMELERLAARAVKKAQNTAKGDINGKKDK
jgi:hypothetical protein